MTVRHAGARHTIGRMVMRGDPVRVRRPPWWLGLPLVPIQGYRLIRTIPRFEDAGVAAVIVTEIGRDGTLAGPDLDGLAAALGRTSLPLIASGGVGTLDDLRALAALAAGERRLAGAIAGKAIYEGRFDVAAGLRALAGTRS